MKCVFVAIGWENLALQALSAVLKRYGHETDLVYDQALFDDKNYLCIKWLAKLFDQKDLVLQRIVELEPDLVAFHVMTVQYQEMRELAKEIKARYRVPVIFGGIHAHSAPDTVLLPDDPAVDIVCLGDGEEALLELCNAIEAGKIDYQTKNLWFRLQGGKIIQNDMRPMVRDIDELPPVDKELFAPHIPLHHAYLSSPSRGCPYNCTFCALSFLADEAKRMKTPRVRERSVDSLIAELKDHIAAYESKWIDFRQPVMSASPKWIVDFFTRYKEEINLPFRCFMHPLLIREDGVRAMRDAGCFAIQIGVESWDQEIRNVVLNRKERNDQIVKAAEILEKERQPYAFDYILGIPRLPKTLPDGTTRRLTEEEVLKSINDELLGFAEFVASLKYCYRIAPFMLQYMPGTDMFRFGIDSGEISEEEAQRARQGRHDNYMSGGSVVINPRRLRLLNGYRVMLRLMSFLPPWAKKLMLRVKAYKVFWMAPFRVFISLLDLMIAVRDKDATTYAKNYVWWFFKRFDRNYHLYMFKKRRMIEKLPDCFELPPDGILGTKSRRGWEAGPAIKDLQAAE